MKAGQRSDCGPYARESQTRGHRSSVNDTDFVAVLDRRLKRIEQMRAKATPLSNGEKADVRLRPVL
jgi:hypothetical protein